MRLIEQVKCKIAKIYYNHGLFCATHPVQVIVCVCIIVVILCIPLIHYPFTKDVPLDHVILKEDEFKAFKNSMLLSQSSGSPNRSLGYSLQIVLHSNILLPPNYVDCIPSSGPLVDIFLQSTKLVRSIRDFRVPVEGSSSNTVSFEDICFQVEDRTRSGSASATPMFNVLPTFGCLILTPSLLWDNNADSIKSYTSNLFTRLKQAATGNIRDILFGLPWQLTGIRRGPICDNQEPNVITFVITLVFREYNSDFIERLREHLHSQFPDVSPRSTPDANTHTKSESSQVYLVWYRGRSYLSDYAPLLFTYVILLLYVYFSVRKLEMVKSKCGLAFSACFTVVASLCMSMGLCLSIGLMVPKLNGSEVFPYLVVLIGFENVIILTKSVVATPIDLPVKYRMAEGLSKESWPLTKHFCTQLALLGLGFFTFHPTMQEFCLFAVIGVTTDFFLQLFFFVTVLSVDIRRIQLSDFSNQFSAVSILPPSDRAPIICARLKPGDTCMETEVEPHTSCEPPVKECSLNKHRVVLCLQRCFQPLKMFRLANLFRFVVKHSLRPFHRRNVSAAEAAAFLSSDAKPGERVPRRLWLLRILAKHRLVQRLFMLVIALWIVLIVAYTFFITKPWVMFQVPNTSPKDIGQSKKSVQLPTGDSDDTSTSTLHGLDRVLRNLDVNGNNDLRSGPFRSSLESTWDTNLLWNYLSFFQWPLLAGYYNLTLAGRHLAILKPIHLNYEVRPSLDLKESLSLTETTSRPKSEFASDHKGDRRLDWNWVPYMSLPDIWTGLSKPSRSEDNGQASADTERLAGFSNELLEFVRDSNPRPVSSVSPGGVAGWTARLWFTATMVGTSLLGCSCVLLFTCLGMICFQELQSKSAVPSTREPVIRVLPLTISLKPTASAGDEDVDNISGADWTIACGKMPRPRTNPSRVDGVIAACSITPIKDTNVLSTESIRLWCTSSGSALPAIQRFQQHSLSSHLDSSSVRDIANRKRSTVWCMGFSTHGTLIVGCSNGSIEVWDCYENRLEHIFMMRSSGQHSRRSAGGITVLDIALPNRIMAGTNRGHTAWFSLDAASDSPFVPPVRQWHSHTRSITQLSHVRYGDVHATLENRFPDRFILLSGSDDGLVCFTDSTSDEPLYRVTNDGTAILSLDFTNLMLAVSYASGSLHVSQLRLRVADNQPCLESVNGSQNLALLTKQHRSPLGYIGLRWFPNSVSVQITDDIVEADLSGFRLVTGQLDGLLAIWTLKPVSVVRTFRMNLSSLSPCNPFVCVDGRVVFGDQGYLRVVNPWTTKYERSVHLLPPSTFSVHSNGVASCSTPVPVELFQQWSQELIPIGVAGPLANACATQAGTPHCKFSVASSVVVSIADGGQTIVVIPFSTVKTE